MHNVVLSPIDPEKLISDISERVTANILEAVRKEPTIQADQWFDLCGLEAYLPEKLARATLYGKLASGEIPGHKRGKKWYFLKSEIDNFLKQGRKKTLSETEAEANTYLKRKGGCHA